MKEKERLAKKERDAHNAALNAVKSKMTQLADDPVDVSHIVKNRPPNG